ncbi:S-adenosyl-L-methionine-dependent methyltransferase [Whalleya microplaca]|nr:S-adenosyl-L-methionine-dependent methyltransferase [Whalleya microplaca]
MPSLEGVKKEYDDQATAYDDYLTTLPYGIMETQLVGSALGDCTGARVLDLGGGTGARARQALAAGAAAVDIVDLSPEMLRIGESIEAALKRREGAVRWLVADVSKPLDHLPLRREYDLVMANWVLDHARTVDELEGMWRNIAAYLRPGGRFVGVRSGNPRAPCVANGEVKYGITYKDFVDVPGGVHFRFVVHSNPPIEFEASSMEVSYSGSTAMHEKFGLCEVETEPYENAEIVRSDPEFWKLLIDDPSLIVVKAKKRLN